MSNNIPLNINYEAMALAMIREENNNPALASVYATLELARQQRIANILEFSQAEWSDPQTGTGVSMTMEGFMSLRVQVGQALGVPDGT